MYKKKNKFKAQSGGPLSSFFGGFGGGKGMDFLSQIGDALQGFSNEPALGNIFSQSNTLFEGFKNQLSPDQQSQIGGADKYKSTFDLFSLFSNGIFGGGNYEDGGEVSESKSKKVSKVKKRFGEFVTALHEGIADQGAAENIAKATKEFNQKYGEDKGDPSQIIPGLHRDLQAFKKGKFVSKSQNNGMQAGGMVIPQGYTPETWFTPSENKVIDDQYNMLLKYMDSPQYMKRLKKISQDKDFPEFNKDPLQILAERKVLLEAARANVKPGNGILPPNVLGSFQPKSPTPGLEGDAALRSRQGDLFLRRSAVINPNNDIVPQSTPIHELTHGSTSGNNLLTIGESGFIKQNTGYEDDYLKAYLGEDYRTTKTPEEINKTMERFLYITDPTEVHARINEVRKMAVDSGLHKKFGQKFTNKDIEVIEGRVKKEPKRYDFEKANRGAYNDLLDITTGSKEKLLNLLNKVAVNDPVKDDQARFTAEKGGVVSVQYQKGGGIDLLKDLNMDDEEKAFIAENFPVKKIESFRKAIDLINDSPNVNINRLNGLLKRIGDPNGEKVAKVKQLNDYFKSNNGKSFNIKNGKLILDEESKLFIDSVLRENVSGFIEPTSPEGYNERVLQNIFNYRSDHPVQWQPPRETFKAQLGGVIPVSSRGQFDYPGQTVAVPTSNGSITMDGVNQTLLAIQNGHMRVLPPNSGMHQFSPGTVMEIPLPNGSLKGNRKK